MEGRRRVNSSSTGPPLPDFYPAKPDLSKFHSESQISQRLSNTQPSQLSKPSQPSQPPQLLTKGLKASQELLGLLGVFKLYSYSNKQLVAIAKSVLTLSNNNKEITNLLLFQTSHLDQDNKVFMDTFQRKIGYLSEFNQQHELSKLFNETEELIEMAKLLISNLTNFIVGVEKDEVILKQIIAGICTSRESLLKLSSLSLSPPSFVEYSKETIKELDFDFSRIVLIMLDEKIISQYKTKEIQSTFKLSFQLLSQIHFCILNYSPSYYKMITLKIKICQSLISQIISLLNDISDLTNFSYFPQLKKFLVNYSLKLKTTFSNYFSACKNILIFKIKFENKREKKEEITHRNTTGSHPLSSEYSIPHRNINPLELPFAADKNGSNNNIDNNNNGRDRLSKVRFGRVHTISDDKREDRRSAIIDDLHLAVVKYSGKFVSENNNVNNKNDNNNNNNNNDKINVENNNKNEQGMAAPPATTTPRRLIPIAENGVDNDDSLCYILPPDNEINNNNNNNIINPPPSFALSNDDLAKEKKLKKKKMRGSVMAFLTSSTSPSSPSSSTPLSSLSSLSSLSPLSSKGGEYAAPYIEYYDDKKKDKKDKSSEKKGKEKKEKKEMKEKAMDESDLVWQGDDSTVIVQLQKFMDSMGKGSKQPLTTSSKLFNTISISQVAADSSLMEGDVITGDVPSNIDPVDVKLLSPRHSSFPIHLLSDQHSSDLLLNLDDDNDNNSDNCIDKMNENNSNNEINKEKKSEENNSNNVDDNNNDNNSEEKKDGMNAEKENSNENKNKNNDGEENKTKNKKDLLRNQQTKFRKLTDLPSSSSHSLNRFAHKIIEIERNNEVKIQITYEEFDVLLKEILSLIFYYAEVNTHQMKAENIEIKSFTTSAIPFVNKAEKLLSNYEDNQRNPFLSFLSPPSDVHLNFFEPPQKHKNNQRIKGDLVDDVESVWEEPVNDKRRVDYSNGKLKKGTLNSLILHLTSAEFQDIHFMKTFITTYRSFTTPIIFLKKLIQRYRVPSHYSSEHQLNIQLRICNILKHWIDTQPNDFDDSLISEFLSFIEEVKLTPTFHLYISSILSSLHKHKQKEASEEDIMEVMGLTIGTSARFSPSSLIFDFSEEEIAQQMTLIDSQFFLSIRPEEFLYQSWNKEKFKYRAKNLVNFIKRFNEITKWVISVILFQNSNKDRARAISKFISLSDHLHRLNNFHATMAVIAGCKSTPVFRLNGTKSLIPPPSLSSFNKLAELYSNNQSYAVYRSHLRSVNPPCVPFIGTFLSDLTYIEDGNADFVEGLINYRKKELLVNVILEIKQFQQIKYKYEVNQQIYFSLFEFPLLQEDEAYNLSCLIEPRPQR